MADGSTGARESVVRIEITGPAIQEHHYIQKYIQMLALRTPFASATEQVVVGEVPQPPPAFQPRAVLVDALRADGPGVPVVRTVTGTHGVGKTHKRH
jgi:hypothetical protein